VGTGAGFSRPHGIAATVDGSMLVIGDSHNHRVRLLDLASFQSSTLAGSGTSGYAEGTAASAQFNHPSGVSATPDGLRVVVADSKNYRIRLVELATGATSLLAGTGTQGTQDGASTVANFYWPSQVAVSPDGATVVVGDYSSGQRVRMVNMQTGATTTLVQTSISTWGVAYTTDGLNVLYVTHGDDKLFSISSSGGTPQVIAGSGTQGFADGASATARFNNPLGIATTPDGNYAIVNDWHGARVRAVHLSTGAVTTLGGTGTQATADGIGAAAAFNYPVGITISPHGSTIYVTETGSESNIRAIAVPVGP